MNLLVIDTATEACSVALQTDEDCFSEFEICPQAHSQRLLPMVDAVLSQAGLKISQMDCLAFGCGPGSFTGIRIATGMIQGLALGTELPVVGVSTLQAMAQQVIQEHKAERVCVAIDARMNEVYFANFVNRQGLAELVGEEQVIAPAQAVRDMPEQPFAIAGTGWSAYSELTDRAQIDAEVLYPSAQYMLPLVKQSLANDLAVSVERIQPIYLRDKVTWKKLPGRE